MSLQLIDGFDHYEDFPTMRSKWTVVGEGGAYYGGYSGFDTSVYIFGRQSWWRQSKWAYLIQSVPSNDTYVIGGFVRQTNQDPGTIAHGVGTWNFFQLQTSTMGTDCHVNVALQNTVVGCKRLNLFMRRGDGTVLGQLYNTVFADEWTHFELKVKVHTTNGTAQLWMNKDLVFDYSGPTQYGSDAFIDTIVVGGINIWGPGFLDLPTQQAWFDNIYIIKCGDGIYPDDHLEPQAVDVITSTADGSVVQWTPYPDANWENVNDTVPDYTTYNVGEAVGVPDTLLHGAATASHDIRGFGLNVAAALQGTNQTAKSLSTIVRVASTDYLMGPRVITTTSNQIFQGLYGYDPATSSAWLASGLNTAEIGYRKTG